MLAAVVDATDSSSVAACFRILGGLLYVLRLADSDLCSPAASSAGPFVGFPDEPRRMTDSVSSDFEAEDEADTPGMLAVGDASVEACCRILTGLLYVLRPVDSHLSLTATSSADSVVSFVEPAASRGITNSVSSGSKADDEDVLAAADSTLSSNVGVSSRIFVGFLYIFVPENPNLRLSVASTTGLLVFFADELPRSGSSSFKAKDGDVLALVDRMLSSNVGVCCRILVGILYLVLENVDLRLFVSSMAGSFVFFADVMASSVSSGFGDRLPVVDDVFSSNVGVCFRILVDFRGILESEESGLRLPLALVDDFGEFPVANGSTDAGKTYGSVSAEGLWVAGSDEWLLSYKRTPICKH